MTQQKKIKLGVFGFGCVGSGLYDVLQKTCGIEAEVVKICVKNPGKARSLPADFFTYDKNDILFHPEIDVVIELIDDADAAFAIVKTALEQGKAVVTANKKMIAEHFEELFQLQQTYQVPLLYEGACCASIPIIRNLEEYYDNDLLTAVEGIFNGSTNYILTKIFDEHIGFDEALRQAQEKGFAESDPRLDIEGYDPKYKLSIILAHAFGVFVAPEKIVNIGIDRLTDFDIRYAREKGYKIRLVAGCRKIDGEIFAAVFPKFVTPEDKLYHINNEYNGVVIESIFSEEQFFAGKGAGSYPTGSAVLSDISALTYRYRYEYKKLFQSNKGQLSNRFSVEVYVRFPKGHPISVTGFSTISESFSNDTFQYIIGRVDYQELINSKWINEKEVIVLFTPGNSIQPIAVEATEELAALV